MKYLDYVEMVPNENANISLILLNGDRKFPLNWQKRRQKAHAMYLCNQPDAKKYIYMSWILLIAGAVYISGNSAGYGGIR